VTVVFVICIPVQVIILVNKWLSAVRGPMPTHEASRPSAADHMDSEEHSASET